MTEILKIKNNKKHSLTQGKSVIKIYLNVIIKHRLLGLKQIKKIKEDHKVDKKK